MENDNYARKCDEYLYFRVCQKINPIYVNLPFDKIFVNRKYYGFPSFKSVERCRRKLQADFPELRANAQTESYRKTEEDKYREYSKERG